MNSPSDQSSKQERVAFRELTESSMEQYGGDMGHRDMSSINPAEVAFNESDLNAAFRSIRASDMVVGEVGLMSRGGVQSTMDNDVHSSRKGSSQTAERYNESRSMMKPEIIVETKKAARGPVDVPRRPVYLPKSHLRVSSAVEELISRTESSLDKCAEVAYSFNNKECKVSREFVKYGFDTCSDLYVCQWDAVYLKGSCRCHFEICVYRENECDESGPLIVEGNRLSVSLHLFI
jgi:hypothetical protein